MVNARSKKGEKERTNNKEVDKWISEKSLEEEQDAK